MRAVERRSLAEEDRDLAIQIGARLKAARLRAGLTQREVAEGRYTKAYVSALENGLIKPSMAALRFLAARLATTPSELLSDPSTRWARLEAELLLAAGDWQAAVDAFQALLDLDPTGEERALTLLGFAEGSARLAMTTEAIRSASEANEWFAAAGRREESQRARYWLAAAHHLADNPSEARMLLEQILAEHTEATQIGGDLRVRLLTALALVMNQAGEPKRAVLLLEEARAIGADIDDRRRATLLLSLAIGYRATGDMEAAITSGLQALALFQSADAAVDVAILENELALIFLAMGNLRDARRHVAEARRGLSALHRDFLLAHVAETEAQISLAGGDTQRAFEQAVAAVELARAAGNQKAEVSALLTEARAHRAAGDAARAVDVLAGAADIARSGPTPRLREILTQWSELLAESGDHKGAYALSREALELG
jgi:transcriptional regulator with XRE-family HTH domain